MTNFVQIHTLTSYPAVLLNRDDAGFAKRMMYGGATRIRVSSQCLKRHWRKSEDEWALAKIGVPMASRSREIIEKSVMLKLSDLHLDTTIEEAIKSTMVLHLYGKGAAEIKNRQALLLGEVEINYLVKLAREAAATGSPDDAKKLVSGRLGKGEGKSNLKALTDSAQWSAGLEGALFGRMVTSDTESNTDAAIHVAHAFTVHEEQSESDYFTVVDDLRGADEAGSAGIFETELTSGLFYNYIVVDVNGLKDNIGGDAKIAGKIVKHLLHLIATVSPGAKRGSTAPYSYAELMLVELGDRQPRSLSASFRAPVSEKAGDVLNNAIKAINKKLNQFDESYGARERRASFSCADEPIASSDERLPLDALAEWAAAAVEAG